MRTKVTLVLLFLNAVLFVFIFRFERLDTERASLEVRRRVLGAEAADIRSLRISGPNGSLSLERRGDTWFLTKPFAWPANPQAVGRIVNDLQFLEHETSFSVRDVIKNGQSLADYGLDHPQMTVTFASGSPETTGSAQVTTTLRLGDTTKTGDRLYLLSPDGQRIHVVGRELADSLSVRPDQIRTDTLLTIPAFEARSLNLQTAAPGGVRVRIRRDPGGRWLFETPILARASRDQTELTIDRLDALRVKSFLGPNPPVPLPSLSPTLRVTIEGDKRRETLLVGPPVDGTAAPAEGRADYYAQLEDRSALFTVSIPTALIRSLDDAAESLRDTHVLDFDPDAVTAVTLAAPNEPDLTLQRLEPGASAGAGPAAPGVRAGPNWQIVSQGEGGRGPQTRPADRGAVQRLLERLALLSAEKFASDAPQAADLENWGFNRPERVITLALQPSSVPPLGISPTQLTLEIGLPTQRQGPAYARVANEASVYAVDPDILRETSVAPTAWRERLLRELPAEARITEVGITNLSDGRTVFRWTAGSAPPRGRSQADALQALLAQLHTLRAQAFVSDSFSEAAAGPEQPWRFRLDAAIALPGDKNGPVLRSSLWLAEREGVRQLAGSREFEAVFAVQQPLLDALWTLTDGAGDPAPPSGPGS